MMTFRPLVHVVSRAVLFPLCLTVPLFAQGFGTVTGTIVDPSGAALAQGNVVATEVATGLSRSSVAGQDGYYVLNSLRPAEYILTVAQTGFEKFRRTGVVLLANQSLTVNITMALGSTTESVTVNGSAAQVDTTTATLRDVVESSRMIELPLNGRNAAQLTTLVAGAVVSPSNNADRRPQHGHHERH